MLTKKQISEIREHLENAQRPIFFFDNDQDGLCSFLLLQRYLGRGKGVPVKSFPELIPDYFRKITELNADYVFILDKPVVSQEFFKMAREINIPIVWIDHHPTQQKIPKFVNYYLGEEPVTALCYEITQRKEDLWLAVIGCISDKFFPSFYSEFKKKYPDLSVDTKNAFDVFYKSKIGRITRILGFSLKDRITNVINMLRFLIKAKTPYEILEESNETYLMHKRFEHIDKKYQKLMQKAKENVKKSDKILFFQYSGDLSISSDLANELSYIFPKKTIVVIYVAGIKANISIRGKDVGKLISKAVKGLKEASGGGHKEAVGAQVRVEDLEKFKENFEKLVG